MTLDDQNEIRSTINVLRGELAAVKGDGSFTGPMADLRDAVDVLRRPGAGVAEFPLRQPPREVGEILNDLLVQRGLLELFILDAPALHGPAGVALGDLNRAIVGIHVAIARQKLRSAT